MTEIRQRQNQNSREMGKKKKIHPLSIIAHHALRVVGGQGGWSLSQLS